jgi:menaquinone-dependent protoporphyrinogen oxidase
MNQNKPILVTYASRSGSTAGVAEAIAKTLAESGAPVEVRPMHEVTDLSSYRAVVAGSAIQGQKWLPEAMQFVRQHRAALAQKPFAAFLVCITLSMKGSEQYRAGVSSWLAPVRALVHPVSEGLFAGALDFSKMPLTINTLMMRVPVLLRIWETGDHRDWTAISAWAESTRPLLNA